MYFELGEQSHDTIFRWVREEPHDSVIIWLPIILRCTLGGSFFLSTPDPPHCTTKRQKKGRGGAVFEMETTEK